MPLQNSFSNSPTIRLGRMGSVPSTDDLRHMLDEIKKTPGKTVEMAFEHPSNHILFVVKLILGPRSPQWTLQRGDDGSARKLWDRASDDLLMVQNKIKTDSSVERPDDPGTAASSNEKAAIVLGDAQGNRSLLPTNIQPAQQQQQQVELGSWKFADNIGPQSDLGDLSHMPAPPKFDLSPPRNPDVSPSFDGEVTVKHRLASHAKSAGGRSFFGQLTADAARGIDPNIPKLPLPEPLQLDRQFLKHFNSFVVDPSTSLDSFAAFVYFLFREFARYQKNETPLASVILEVGFLETDYVVVPNPAQVIEIGLKLRTLCSPLDVPTFVSGGEFAVLLPSSGGREALDFAINLHDAILDGTMFANRPVEQIKLAIGVAAMPDTCKHPEIMLAAARKAKDLSKSSPSPFLLFPV